MKTHLKKHFIPYKLAAVICGLFVYIALLNISIAEMQNNINIERREVELLKMKIKETTEYSIRREEEWRRILEKSEELKETTESVNN